MARRERRPGTKTGTQIYVFTDLVGSTRLFETLGDDVADPLIRSHLRELGWSVTKHGGSVVKSLGDGLMAVFTSATAAVDCSIEMQRHIHWQNEAAPDRALGLRVGVHAGEATFDGSDYYGAAVWVARRICDVAGSAEILCSDVFIRLLGTRGGHALERRGEVQVKGVNEPVVAWLVGWSAGDSAPVLTAPKEPVLNRTSLTIAAIAAVVVTIATVWFAVDDNDTKEPVPDGGGGTQVREPETVAVAVTDVSGSSVGIRSSEPAVAKGDVVAFSALDHLVRDDHDRKSDVYLRKNDTTQLISLPIEGRFSTGASGRPAISDDGRRIVFESTGDNLVADVGNGGVKDVFLYDLDAREMTLMSVRNNGNPGRGPSMAPDISADGDVVAFASDAKNLALVGDHNGVRDVFLHYVGRGATNRVSIGPDNLEADGPSYSPSISTDGGLVAYASQATNLVAHDTNRVADVFVYDVELRSTERISVPTFEDEADQPSYSPSISADGRFVAFTSEAALVPEDDNEQPDVYLFDRARRDISLVSATVDGTSGDGASDDPSISADGARVAFTSDSTDLLGDAVSATQRVYVWTRGGDTLPAGVTNDGELVDAISEQPALSSDGSYVAFVTELSALIGADNDSFLGVFLRGPLLGT